MTRITALVLAAALLLAGCATPTYSQHHEVEASLPRAIGMGAFAPNCLLFCLVHARFTRGDELLEDIAPVGGTVTSKRKTDIQGVKP